MENKEFQLRGNQDLIFKIDGYNGKGLNEGVSNFIKKLNSIINNSYSYIFHRDSGNMRYMDRLLFGGGKVRILTVLRINDSIYIVKDKRKSNISSLTIQHDLLKPIHETLLLLNKKHNMDAKITNIDYD